MKLIQRTTLLFQEGSSDKVYEIDLCEVGADAFIVNFRYGRRGANLKEGSKTVSAVSRAEADKAFAALVAEKTKKGYQPANQQSVNAAPIPVKALKAKGDAAAREQAVLQHLQYYLQPSSVLSVFKKKPHWPLERVIWRAGELKIRAAAPLIVQFIQSGNALRDYCCAWALGWCGDEPNNSALVISALGRLGADHAQPAHVRRIAREAIRKLISPANRAQLATELINELPVALRQLAAQGPAEQFTQALQAHVTALQATAPVTTAHQVANIFETLYDIDNVHVRPALLAFLRTTPLRPNSFNQLRHIFKAAEYRRDGEAFGIIAYRFEHERAMFRQWIDMPRSKDINLFGSTVYGPKSQLGKPDAQFAYSDRTRLYLRHRVWRTLRRLGEIDDADYVNMAVGVLLPFTDADAQAPREAVIERWDHETWQRLPSNNVAWDRFAPYVAFNHLLYQNSPRYQLKPRTIAWRCRRGYNPGDPVPAVREEAFPRLWEATPAGLLHLLIEGNCAPVHEFAAKALQACGEFCQQLDTPIIALLLSRPYEATAKLGFALAQARYQANNPDKALVLAVATCCDAEARRTAQRWIDESRSHFVTDNNFLVALATCAHTDTRTYARQLLLTTDWANSTQPDAVRALIVRLLATLLTLEPSQSELATDVALTVQTCFAPQLRNVGMEIVRDLLDHPLLPVQQLGGFILLNHQTPADQLPEQIIRSLIASPHAVMRGIGIKLMGQWPDERLLQNEEILIAFATHELADLRQAIRPVLQRLSAPHPDFAARLAHRFMNVMQRREPHPGVHRALLQILQHDLGDQWQLALDRVAIWRLIYARGIDAQDLGGSLLAGKVAQRVDWLTEITTSELAKLSNHELKTVRDAAMALFIQHIHRYQAASNPTGYQAELTQAVRLLDSDWEDARQFYFAAFTEHFTAAEFTPTLLVSICDSVRPDVQKFGRDLLTRYFADADGQEYLLKLSEHPTANMQLFATNYLERYATGNVARLRELQPYFTSVLARVNRARVAKSRVLNFLAAEAHKSSEAAVLVADILTRQSLTMAIGDKAATIETMLAIRRAYPTIDLPIQVQQTTVRQAASLSAVRPNEAISEQR